MGLTRLPPAPAPFGWWLDSDPVLLDHGTATQNLDSIGQNGLKPTDAVFLTPDYETAKHYSFFGPEGGDRVAIRGYISGQLGIKIHPLNHYAVAHLEVPRSFIEEFGQYRPLTVGAGFFDIARRKLRLAERDHYDQSDEADSSYYRWTEVLFRRDIPAEFVKGASLPYVRS